MEMIERLRKITEFVGKLIGKTEVFFDLSECNLVHQKLAHNYCSSIVSQKKPSQRTHESQQYKTVIISH